MKVSLNWVKEYTKVDLPINKLVEKIGNQLGAVEEFINLGKKYEGILIVKVISSEKHPNGDKLSFCLVDDGRVNKKVKRNTDDLIEIVCGAPNVKAGMLAAWIPPGATVPSTFDKEPFTIEAREIRGKMSSGMLASSKELALGDSHEGLLVIDQKIKPGTAFAEAYELNDYIIDIENKMFTHRPDLFGMLGIAREIAGITHQTFQSPGWYKQNVVLPKSKGEGLRLDIKNDIPELVPRFLAVTISGLKVGPSPAWLQSKLSRIGIRPINSVVDMTNFLMLETAQPLHAYDYDKVKTGTLGVRLSKKDETLKLLGGKEVKLQGGSVVITDGQKPIGLGGVMGGADTEVSDDTKNIILECATFEANIIRKTAMTYGFFTDAATRFTKNQSPLQNAAVLAKAVEDIIKICGGAVASDYQDVHGGFPQSKAIVVKPSFINERLGLELTGANMAALLKNTEFDISPGEALKVKSPFWRTDIKIPEDVVEEVGRLYGYDHLVLKLPIRDLTPAKRDNLIEFKSKIRNILTRAGANEVLTYSFVHASLLQKSGQKPEMAYKIRNALSPELHHFRLSLTPSLLEKIHPNIKAGYDNLALFEINKTHNKTHHDKQEKNLPQEFETLALVLAANSKAAPKSAAAYYQTKTLLDWLGAQAGLSLTYLPAEKETASPVMAPYDPQRSALITNQKDGKILGIIGEFRSDVIADFKLPVFSAGFEVDIQQLLAASSITGVYQPLNRFPSLDQDFCLRTPASLKYAKLFDSIQQALVATSQKHGYGFEIKPLDIFQPETNREIKQTSWRITLSHPERTLTTTEINQLLDRVAGKVKTELGAERV